MYKKIPPDIMSKEHDDMVLSPSTSEKRRRQNHDLTALTALESLGRKNTDSCQPNSSRAISLNISRINASRKEQNLKKPIVQINLASKPIKGESDQEDSRSSSTISSSISPDSKTQKPSIISSIATYQVDISSNVNHLPCFITSMTHKSTSAYKDCHQRKIKNASQPHQAERCKELPVLTTYINQYPYFCSLLAKFSPKRKKQKLEETGPSANSPDFIVNSENGDLFLKEDTVRKREMNESNSSDLKYAHNLTNEHKLNKSNHLDESHMDGSLSQETLSFQPSLSNINNTCTDSDNITTVNLSLISETQALQSVNSHSKGLISSNLLSVDCLSQIDLGTLEDQVMNADDTDTKSIDEDDAELFDSYSFIAELPPLESLPPPASRPRILPLKSSNSPPVTLVLDLDETLVHCSGKKILNPDLIFTILVEGIEWEIYVRKRPGFEEFLERVSKLFEITIFTASERVYAEKLLSILDPYHKWFHHLLFRDSCILVLGSYLKDLTVLGRELSQVVIVDNSPHAFGYHLDNGIPIESWIDNHLDRELLHLLFFLETIANCPDVRPIIRSKFQLYQRVENSRKLQMLKP